MIRLGTERQGRSIIKNKTGRKWHAWTAAAAVVMAASVANAAVVIEDGSEAYTADNGDAIGSYYAITGGVTPSAPGQVFEVLGPTAGSKVHSKGTEFGYNTFDIGDLWSVLNGEGIISTSSLVFGVGINESGPAGTNPVTLTQLVMTFELPDGSTQAFDLSGDEVEIYNYNQGASTGEALVQVDFGNFDFMSQYDANSDEQFFIFAEFQNASGGFENIYLSGAASFAPPVEPTVFIIPEPATMALVGLGALLIGHRRRVA